MAMSSMPMSHHDHPHGHSPIHWHRWRHGRLRRGTTRHVLLIARHDGTAWCPRKFDPDSTGKLEKPLKNSWRNCWKGCALNYIDIESIYRYITNKNPSWCITYGCFRSFFFFPDFSAILAILHCQSQRLELPKGIELWRNEALWVKTGDVDVADVDRLDSYMMTLEPDPIGLSHKCGFYRPKLKPFSTGKQWSNLDPSKILPKLDGNL